jgi:nucleoside-diphosphate-sugar epimerase
LQEAGAPVVTIYPGAVYGPHDPYRGDQSETLRWVLLGWRYPADREGVEIVRRNTRLDDSAARKELGVEPTSFTQTITDMIRWLVESGRVPARYAGKLGPA